MRALSAAELLDAWERSTSRPLIDRATALLAAACPDAEADALSRLSIGQRDSLLLSLRELTFGAAVAAVASCPDCNEQLEVSFRVEDIRLPADLSGPEPARLALAEYELSFRLPNSLDLSAASAQGDAEAARQTLIERCLLSAHKQAEEVPFTLLPETVLAEVENEMSRLDPQVNVQLALDCPSCNTQWSAAFDVLSFFWSELNAWAERLLADVHGLASAYGWREADILELSPARRNIYLNMVGG